MVSHNVKMNSGYRYLLGVIDVFSREARLIPLKDKSGPSVAEAFRDLFASNPEKYAPAFGGYCAYGVSQGVKVDFDPDAWAVIDGQLYLNLDPDVQKRWQRDIPGHIAKANRNWPKLRDK